MWATYRAGRNFLLAIVVVVPLVSCSKSENEDDENLPSVELTADAHAAADCGNRIAFDLYRQLRGRAGNLVFSPSSLSIALAMNYAGAAGTTQSEMAKALHFDMPEPALNDGMQVFQDYLKAKGSGKRVQLKLANRLWGQNGYPFLPAFTNLARTKYGAEPQSLDFVADASGARERINQWCADQTEDKIPAALPTDELTADTVLVLTNAIYFRGNWSKQFDKSNTEDGDFRVGPEKTVRTPFMSQKHAFRTANFDDLQVLELPYVDETLSMLFVLPDAVDGLAALEEKLTPEKVQTWIDNLHPGIARVSLPKFRFASQVNLSETLQALGMKSAFSISADFSKLSDRKPLFLAAVNHAACIEVNEQGTEAAAVTENRSVKSSPGLFHADHPFFFFIRDNESGAILFMGRILDPRS